MAQVDWDKIGVLSPEEMEAVAASGDMSRVIQAITDGMQQLQRVLSLVFEINSRDVVKEWLKAVEPGMKDRLIEVRSLRIIGLTFPEIAKLVDLSERRCQALDKKARKQLKEAVKSE